MNSPSNSVFATTLDYFDSAAFSQRAKWLMKRPSPGKLSSAIQIFTGVLGAARHEKSLLLASSWGREHPELLATAVIGLWPRQLRPKIYLLGCMWEPNPGIRSWIEKFILKLADRSITRYIVQSTDELTVFPRQWGVPAEKVRFCPFFYTIKEHELPQDQQSIPASISRQDFQNGYVFAGGNSMRDYESLVIAARLLPNLTFVFATSLLDGHADLSPNIIHRQVSHLEFMRLMYYSTATVVPLKAGLHRAAGQQTYLNAMYLGKPTIITDSLAVRDHVRDWETAIIVDGTPESYVHALEWIFNPVNCAAVERLSQAGRKDVTERFSFERHVDRVLEIIREAEEERLQAG